jgi:hypothetical protein
LIIEPKYSTYHDPKTGAIVDSGALVDIHTNTPLAPGSVDGSFREQAIWTINDNDQSATSTINLRSEPLTGRDPATRFSSYVNGDPFTPMPLAYPGDKVVLRMLSVSPTLDTFHVQGARFRLENRYADADGPEGQLIDTLHHAISERSTLILDGGGGGSRKTPGDYLYFSGSDARQQQGAWGLIRVLPGSTPNLKPLPDNAAPAGTYTPPTGTAPPATTGAGNPCPITAPVRSFAISSMDLNKGSKVTAFVRTADVASIRLGNKKVEPLVLHVAAGDCVDVDFRNQRDPSLADPTLPKSSFSVSKLQADPESTGVDAGYASEQNVAPGGRRSYRFYVDSPKLGTATIADFGANSAKLGLYGAVVVAPEGASFTDPVTGFASDIGSQVDVHLPSGYAYRDFTVDFADDAFELGHDFMPYRTTADNRTSTINYAAGRAGDGPDAFSTVGTPALATPLLRAYPGDHMMVHALVAPGSEQGHVFSLGGLAWETDQWQTNSQRVSAQGFGPWESIDASVVGGAGGWAARSAGATGDLFYGDLRKPFTVAGQWGLQRVLPKSSCVLRNLDGSACGADPTPGNGPAVFNVDTSSGPVGTRIVIYGLQLTGATHVTFGGVEATTFNVSSDSKITATVPRGAVSGNIVVTSPDGTAMGPYFGVD